MVQGYAVGVVVNVSTAASDAARTVVGVGRRVTRPAR
jgi:hypothetical protein